MWRPIDGASQKNGAASGTDLDTEPEHSNLPTLSIFGHSAQAFQEKACR
jgi:hypothetical protein